MTKILAPCPAKRLGASILITATLIFSFVVINTTRSNAQTGQATGRRQYKPLNIAKNAHLGPGNVLRTKADVKFEKEMKDLMGKTRRIEIYKVEELKTPGLRYYARIDGEERDITYLRINGGKIGLVNVEGTKPEHNLNKHYYATRGTKLTNGEFRAQNRILAEYSVLPGKQTAFSAPKKYVDDHSFILLWADPIHIAGLKPAEVFGSSGGSADTAKPPIDDGGWLIPIEVWLACKMSSRNLKDCDEGCGGPPVVESWGDLGVSRGKLCKDQGCIMCAGVCCIPAKCTSQTNPNPYLDYGFKIGN